MPIDDDKFIGRRHHSLRLSRPSLSFSLSFIKLQQSSSQIRRSEDQEPRLIFVLIHFIRQPFPSTVHRPKPSRTFAKQFTNKMQRLLSLFTLWSCLVIGVKSKKSYDVPHPHKAILKAFETGPFDIELAAEDEAKLSQGKSVMKQTEGKDSGTSLCVQDIDAPKEAVWAQILDFPAYKGKVPKVKESHNYEIEEQPDGTCQIKTKMVVSVLPGYTVREDVFGY